MLCACSSLLRSSSSSSSRSQGVGEEAKRSLRTAFFPVENHVEEINETLKKDEANEEIDEDYSGEFLDSFHTLDVQR